MNPLLILAVIAVLVVVFVIAVYNDLATLKTRIHASIQEIGNQLKRQSELIPNLEESAKGYLKHEKEIFKQLTDARKSVDSAVASGELGLLSDAASKVAEVLPLIRVAVESNPEIKGSDVVKQLMDELRDTSDKGMYARRTVIDLSADYNVKLVTFPSNLVANMFGFQKEVGLSTPTSGSHIEVSASETQPHRVKLS